MEEPKYIRDEDGVLLHYGVKGMKWGIRRYQPYTKSNKRKDNKGGVFKGVQDARERRRRRRKAGIGSRESLAFGVRNRPDKEKLKKDFEKRLQKAEGDLYRPKKSYSKSTVASHKKKASKQESKTETSNVRQTYNTVKKNDPKGTKKIERKVRPLVKGNYKKLQKSAPDIIETLGKKEVMDELTAIAVMNERDRQFDKKINKLLKQSDQPAYIVNNGSIEKW